jgi:hypothetical protein
MLLKISVGNQPLPAAVTIPLTIGGTASPGIDYLALPTSVTIPAGAFQAAIPITVLSDAIIEGAETIVSYIEKKLGIKDGETTSDGIFTLKTVECLGACGYAPMLQAGEKFHEHLTEEKVDQLIEMYRNKPVANYMGLENNG